MHADSSVVVAEVYRYREPVHCVEAVGLSDYLGRYPDVDCRCAYCGATEFRLCAGGFSRVTWRCRKCGCPVGEAE
jgi:hypothetical protein